jgi:hypothetical protein
LLAERPIILDDSDPRLITTRPNSSATLIARADFTQHGLTPTALPGYESTATWSQWSGGASFSVIGDYIEGDYPDTTAGNASGGLSLSLENLAINDVYIEAQVRMPSLTKGGFKFIKVFGANTGVDYCNTTYGIEADGEFMRISFGDGTLEGEEVTGNDTHRNIFYDGANPTWMGRNFGLANIVTRGSSFHFDENWHTLRIHHNFHSGTTALNENNDGEYFVGIDGIIYCDAKQMFNRHWSNSPNLLMINFFDWAQNSLPFKVDMRNIKISTGGFING